MDMKIALAGNPNSGKTTLFNALTGSNQFVGNWPGVTVEKKEGKLKKHDGVVIADLPGIYSLSPYTLEEVIARNYLIDEKPDAILNIVDGSNLERNLYLTTQLLELGIPMVIAINMMDVVRKNGDKIDIQALTEQLGCPIVEISALKGEKTMEAAEEASGPPSRAGKSPPTPSPGRWNTRWPTSRRRLSTRCPRPSSVGMRSSCSSGTKRSSKSSASVRTPSPTLRMTSPPSRPNWTTTPRASSPANAIPTSPRSSSTATTRGAPASCRFG